MCTNCFIHKSNLCHIERNEVESKYLFKRFLVALPIAIGTSLCRNDKDQQDCNRTKLKSVLLN